MKTDVQLKKDVETELDWDPEVESASIGVEVRNGIVTLAGHLHSYPEKLAAERAAQRVAGVKGVAVEIDVKLPGSSHRTDGDIAQAATDALRWNASIPYELIKVKVDGGWITLSGDVDWNYQRTNAETAVRSLIGVKGVINLIQLKQKVSPANVKTKIEAALQRAAHFDVKGIKVLVDHSTVTLEGKVHSLAEHRLVKNATWAAPGVLQVVDHLMIG
ncbi:BON domain-containing protein [Nevskia soli]|uniref:BON domain-containing protein n=1 Tax=Nevskia soli TaxID=418856 RepID=UPI0004A76EEC|nr:BON domain-containing protein [Nevskia soli]